MEQGRTAGGLELIVRSPLVLRRSREGASDHLEAFMRIRALLWLRLEHIDSIQICQFSQIVIDRFDLIV